MVTLDATPPAYDESASQLNLTLTADPSGRDVLITVKPPAAPLMGVPKPEKDEKEEKEQLKAKRAPVDFVLTIDVSDSMSSGAPIPGENERTGLSVLDVVKHAANTIITTMKPEDRIAIVSFAGIAEVVLPLTHTDKEGKAKALKEVESLRPSGNTNLWDGLKQSMNILTGAPPAADPESPGSTIASLAAAGGAIVAGIANMTMDTPLPSLEYGNPKHRLSSIFLLTDGQPNVKPPRGHIPMLKLYLESRPKDKTKFTINTFGFGYSLDSKLLNDIAKIGNGHFGFIADSGMVGTNFVHAVANTYVTYAEGLFVDIEVDDSEVAKEMEVLGSFEVNKASWGVQVPLGQLQYGQTRDVVIRLPKSLSKSPVTVTARCRPWDSDEELKTTQVISDAHLPPSESATDPALLYQSFRLDFVSTVHKEIAATGSNSHGYYFVSTYPVPPNAATAFKDIVSRIHAAFPGEKPAEPSVASDALDLGEDISGQVLLGIADSGAFNKWGLHYLLSLSRSHQRQQCGNFKDPGLQPYGRDSVLFKTTRDEIDTTFDDLPPPKPSLSVTSYSGIIPPSTVYTIPMVCYGQLASFSPTSTGYGASALGTAVGTASSSSTYSALNGAVVGAEYDMASSSEYVLSRGAACLSCRKKKQRCDAEKPTCGPCVKSAKECIYKEPPRSKHQELPDKTDYLQTRIRDLDNTNLRPAPSSSSRSSGGSSRSRERDTPSPSQPSPTSSERPSHHHRTSSRGEPVPGANMVWNYDPIAIANLQIQPSDLTPRLREDLIGSTDVKETSQQVTVTASSGSSQQIIDVHHQQSVSVPVAYPVPVGHPNLPMPIASGPVTGISVPRPSASSVPLSMKRYNSRSAPCFAGSSIIELPDGEKVPVGHLLVGSSVKTPLGSAKVTGIVRTSSPDGSFDLCELGDGLLITPWHPVYVSEEGTWRFPADIVASRQTACSAVYSLILEENQDSDGHAVFIGGIRCVTMGHGVVDPVDVRSHPFLANHFSVMQALKAHPEFTKGPVDVVGTIKDAETDLMCGFLWKQDPECLLNVLPEVPSVLLAIEARSLTVEA